MRSSNHSPACDAPVPRMRKGPNFSEKGSEVSAHLDLDLTGCVICLVRTAASKRPYQMRRHERRCPGQERSPLRRCCPPPTDAPPIEDLWWVESIDLPDRVFRVTRRSTLATAIARYPALRWPLRADDPDLRLRFGRLLLGGMFVRFNRRFRHGEGCPIPCVHDRGDVRTCARPFGLLAGAALCGRPRSCHGRRRRGGGRSACVRRHRGRIG